jgi:ubiquinone/menaquinone biosynthesis C-methylase UbiE
MLGIDLVKFSHQRLVFNRRADMLAARLAPLFPPNASVLDIGCGDGTIDQQILNRRPDVSIAGVDLFVRPSSRISVIVFDGNNIPYRDASFDVAMFVDVLHHTKDPEVLLRQAKRVAKKSIVIKDHFRNGFLADTTLRVMDWVGNAAHGVALPYNYWSREDWTAAFQSLSLEPDEIVTQLSLYPMPASLIFDRGLHFIARLPVGSL